MTVTLCGVCGKEVCVCVAPQSVAKPVEQSVYADGQWHNGIRITNARCYAEPLIKSPVILPDILETAVFGSQTKNAAVKKTEQESEKRKKK